MQALRSARGLPGLRLLLASGLVLGILVLRSTPSTATTTGDQPSSRPAGQGATQASAPPAPADPASLPGIPRTDRPGTRGGDTDGVLPDDVTAFDDEYAGVGNLDAGLLASLRQATKAAAAAGVEIVIASGWRSPDYQARLLRQAVEEYGSEEAAARWVATPETSPHVAGEAVDVGHDDGIAWLTEHGSRFGLCQVYRNEPWHFELRPTASDRGCPRLYADAAHDPRMGR